MPLSVKLSLLCLGWPCFRFRGFERVGLLVGRGAWAVPVSWEPWQLERTPGKAHRVWLPRGKPGAPGLSHSAGDIRGHKRPRRLY